MYNMSQKDLLSCGLYLHSLPKLPCSYINNLPAQARNFFIKFVGLYMKKTGAYKECKTLYRMAHMQTMNLKSRLFSQRNPHL